MSARLTNTAEGGPETTAAVQKVIDEGEAALSRLQSLVDEDTAAFNAVMAAFKMPKNTDGEKAARKEAIAEAMMKAALTPQYVANDCVSIMSNVILMLRFGNRNTASDAAVAGRMAYAGMWGAIYNTRINLASIKNEAFVREQRDCIAAILEQGEKLMAEIIKLSDENIKP
jgi:formiminotetrahydrofolate cyclodeaminase